MYSLPLEVTFSKNPPRSHEETVTSLSLLYMGTHTKGQRAQPSCQCSTENSEISVKDLFLPAILTFFFLILKYNLLLMQFFLKHSLYTDSSAVVGSPGEWMTQAFTESTVTMSRFTYFWHVSTSWHFISLSFVDEFFQN